MWTEPLACWLQVINTVLIFVLLLFPSCGANDGAERIYLPQQTATVTIYSSLYTEGYQLHQTLCNVCSTRLERNKKNKYKEQKGKTTIYLTAFPPVA